MVLPEGVTKAASHQGTSFARYAGIIVTFTLAGLAIAQLVGFMTLEICNPVIEGGKLVTFQADSLAAREIVRNCVPRLQPSALAAWSTAIGGTLGAMAGWFYSTNKRAATALANGS